MNPSDWNNILSTVIENQNTEVRTSSRILDMSLKSKGYNIQRLGRLVVMKNEPKMFWSTEILPLDEDEFDDHEEDDSIIPDKFKRLISKDKSSGSGCATSSSEFRIENDEESNDEDEEKIIVVNDVDDAEWWTMVGCFSKVYYFCI